MNEFLNAPVGPIPQVIILCSICLIFGILFGIYIGRIGR